MPVLNNLLENREMALEDGRFLVAPNRYDLFLKEKDKYGNVSEKLVRVHPQFRVIAIGIPVPVCFFFFLKIACAEGISAIHKPIAAIWVTTRFITPQYSQSLRSL